MLKEEVTIEKTVLIKLVLGDRIGGRPRKNQLNIKLLFCIGKRKRKSNFNRKKRNQIICNKISEKVQTKHAYKTM